MPIISVKEAAERCSIPPKNIHTYIARGKLIKRKDNLIDDSNPINIEFFSKFCSTVSEPKIEPKSDVKPSKKDKETPKIQEKPSTKRYKKDPEDSEPELSNYISSNELNKLKAEEMKEKIKALKLKNKKQSGELISLESSKIIFNIHISNIITALYNMTDNYTADLCGRTGSDRNVLAEFRGKLKKLINDVSLKAKQQSEKDLLALMPNVVDEEDEEEETE